MQALPLTSAITLATIILLVLRYRPGPLGAVAAMVTCVLINVTLGLSISVLGLVSMTRGQLAVPAEFFGMLVLLVAVFVATVAGLTRARFRAGIA